MKAQYFIALFVAILLGASTLFVYRHPETLRNYYFSLSNSCTLEKQYCIALLSPIKILSETSFEIRRKRTPLEKLPILRIYISDGALKKLQHKRLSTLKEKRQILLSEPDDWVKATLLSDDGHGSKKAKAQLRLKGDWADHLHDSHKLSFRIKIRNKEKIFGMRKFSIQAPETRKHHIEPLMLDMMRKVDVLAPRYFFVDVRINDMKIGIMALEEHFTKQLLESQHRREGPIVAIDEEWIWRQRHLNFNRSTIDFQSINFPQSGTHYSYRDLPIKVFSAGKFIPGTARSQQNMRAMALLRDFMDGKVPGSKVFDADKVSRWWIVTNIWHGLHGAITHNLRFYFNPVTGLFEPVAFDTDSEPRNKMHLINSIATTALLKDENFRRVTLDNLNVITGMLLSEEFEQYFNNRQLIYRELLGIDGFDFNDFSVSELKLNLADFIRKFDETVDSIPAAAISDSSKDKLVRAVDPIHSSLLLKQNTPLHTHLRSSLFWHPKHIELEFKNLTLQPVTVNAVYMTNKPENNLLTHSIVMPSYEQNKADYIYTQNINLPETILNENLQVEYEYMGKTYSRPLILQFRDYNSGFLDQEAANNWYREQGIVIKKNGKTLLFPPGQYRLDKSLEVDRHWKVVLLPGVEFTLLDGATMKINGPLYSLGTDENPVRINIQSSADKGALGSWGGIQVMESSRPSHIKHTTISGSIFAGLPERQDSSGLTGCITFYQNNVIIKHSTFTDLQCEDALNIISSSFTLDHSTFHGSQADAFDSDFSTGNISDSTFSHIGNDGVDVSGSTVNINSSRFDDINDKGVSVGEESRFSADNIEISSATSGIVSKDNSVANVKNSHFKNINGTALFAYVKKQEYGPSELHCTRCTFENVESIAAEQFGSTITIDNNDIETTPFTRSQLRAADYIR